MVLGITFPVAVRKAREKTNHKKQNNISQKMPKMQKNVKTDHSCKLMFGIQNNVIVGPG
jgi:hypothetical protein